MIVQSIGLRKEYRLPGGLVRALDGVTLELAPAQLVVVLGPSGSGKTTLLNLVGGLDRPTSGRLVVAGTEISGLSRSKLARFRRRHVSFVFQAFNLVPALTAAENIRFGAEAVGRRLDPRALARLLSDIGLEARGRHFPDELSGGEQQRVAIARAVAAGSPLMLADEPTGELDDATSRRVLEILRRYVDNDGALILVTHDREIARFADRVIEMRDGHVVRDDPATSPERQTAADDALW